MGKILRSALLGIFLGIFLTAFACATVTTTSTKVTYAGSGSTGPFAFSFPVFSASDLQVIEYDSSGNPTTLTLNTDYTVSGLPASGAGTGSVTLTNALATGYTLVIMRAMQDLQTQNWSPGILTSTSLNNSADSLEMQIQQAQEEINRSILLSPLDTGPFVLPPAAERANRALMFDSSGNPTVGELLSTALPATVLSALAGGGFQTPGPVKIGEPQPITNNNPQYYDPACGTWGHDCTSAWISAVAATPVGGTMQLPAGYLYFTGAIPAVNKAINIHGSGYTGPWNDSLNGSSWSYSNFGGTVLCPQNATGRSFLYQTGNSGGQSGTVVSDLCLLGPGWTANPISIATCSQSAPQFPTWTANTLVSVGTAVIPPTPNGYVYVAYSSTTGTNTGTTGNAPPSTWPTSGTFVDGQLVRQAIQISTSGFSTCSCASTSGLNPNDEIWITNNLESFSIPSSGVGWTNPNKSSLWLSLSNTTGVTSITTARNGVTETIPSSSYSLFPVPSTAVLTINYTSAPTAVAYSGFNGPATILNMTSTSFTFLQHNTYGSYPDGTGGTVSDLNTGLSMGSALGCYSTHENVNNVGIFNFGVGFSSMSQYSHYDNIDIDGTYIGLKGDSNGPSFTLQNLYSNVIIGAQEIDVDLSEVEHCMFNSCVLNKRYNNSDPFAHLLWSANAAKDLYNNLTAVASNSIGGDILLESGPNEGSTFNQLSTGATVRISGDSGCTFIGGNATFIIDVGSAYTGFVNMLAPTNDFGIYTKGIDVFGNQYHLINACSGSQSLSSGTATVTNSCITGSRPIVCQDQSNLLPIKCSWSAGSLTMSGPLATACTAAGVPYPCCTGSGTGCSNDDTIVWSQQ